MHGGAVVWHTGVHAVSGHGRVRQVACELCEDKANTVLMERARGGLVGGVGCASHDSAYVSGEEDSQYGPLP
jgi:hypothetical protein